MKKPTPFELAIEHLIAQKDFRDPNDRGYVVRTGSRFHGDEIGHNLCLNGHMTAVASLAPRERHREGPRGLHRGRRAPASPQAPEPLPRA